MIAVVRVNTVDRNTHSPPHTLKKGPVSIICVGSKRMQCPTKKRSPRTALPSPINAVVALTNDKSPRAHEDPRHKITQQDKLGTPSFSKESA